MSYAMGRGLSRDAVSYAVQGGSNYFLIWMNF